MGMSEKIQLIAEAQQKIHSAGQLSILRDSAYLRGSEVGNVITANDVTPIEHDLDITLQSKNLFDETQITGCGGTIGGVKPEYGVVENGYLKSTYGGYGQGTYWVGFILFLDVGKYTISTDIMYIQDATNSKAINIGFRTVDLTTGTLGSENAKTVKVTDFSTWERHCVTVDVKTAGTYYFKSQPVGGSAQYKNMDVRFKNLQIELGDTATEYSPYVSDFSNVNISRYGKNLFDGSIQKGYGLSGTGDNRTVYSSDFNGYKIIRVKPNTTYYFSGDFSVAKDNTIRFASFTEYPTENSVSNKFSHTGSNRAFTTTANDNYLFIWISAPQKTTDIAMQIEEGTNATEYEPYSSQTVTANADGMVEGIKSLSPNMCLYTDIDGVNIDCKYYRDIDYYIDNLTTNVALTGGD